MSVQVHVSRPYEGVAQLLVETGPGNFSTAALHERLEVALTEVRVAGARVVVLGSHLDGVFISHGHIGDIVASLAGRGEPSGDPRAMLRVQRELDTGPMVSIAAIDGQAWGGGLLLALACDLRVASEGATVGQPEIMAGVTTAGEAARIAHIAGEAVAKHMILDGRPFSAEDAHRVGLVHRLVPRGEALAAAVAWAEWLAGRSPGDLAMVKELITGARDLPLSEALKRETGVFVSKFADETVVSRLLAVQERYDAGADSYEAFGLPKG
jgi:enoyl-CoA hydratase/carnithine racemase